MTRSQVNKFPRGSVEYVIAHAQWRKKRGRRPSMSLGAEKNPAKALAIANTFTGVGKRMTILVRNKFQKIPARLYGDANFGENNYDIRVCEDPNIELAQLGKTRAMIYHFS